MRPHLIGSDRAAGLLFFLLGALGLWLGRDLPFGELTNIGSGFVPKIAFGGLLLIGAGKLVASCLRPDQPIGLLFPRPLLLVSAAFVIFGLLIERGGLVIAIAAMLVAVEYAGAHRKSLRGLLVLVVGLTLFSLVVFKYVLGIPLEILPTWD